MVDMSNVDPVNAKYDQHIVMVKFVICCCRLLSMTCFKIVCQIYNRAVLYNQFFVYTVSQC